MATTPLFSQSSMSLDEKVDYMERLLKAKCQSWHLTLGFFQAFRGPEDHNTHGCVKSKTGESVVISKPAESLHEMITNIIEVLERL
jgi:hypothetical protein